MFQKTTFALLVMVLIAFSCTQKAEKINRVQDFNFEWKFQLDSTINASAADFDDSEWRTLNLPHDWSVEFPFDTVNGEGCVAWLPGGIGWYRKHFDVEKDKNITILFDGVYNNSEFWINGEKLGFHPYGYTPVKYDITPYVTETGKNNVIAVKVDRTRFADSRWYPGSGIYRNVQLISTGKIYIPVWGTFITTPEANSKSAEVVIQTSVKNADKLEKEVELCTRILDPSGIEVQKESRTLKLAAGTELENIQNITLSNPELWGVEQPKLYTAVSQVLVDGKVVDEYNTTFGIRTFYFDAAEGFFLNGENMKIKGVCLHHDGGLVGAAVPKEVWRRRLQTLKDGGCNAIRVSHNPASDEFLELCDEIGFLVQDEFFDEWDYPKDKRLNMNQRISTDYITRSYTEHFQEWAEHDLKTTVLAHRNHPCIIQWSIGNEIEWTYPRNKEVTGFWDADWSGNYFWSPTPLTPEVIKARYESMEALEFNIGETAQKLSKWTKEMDTTRPVIANCILPSASYVTGYADALDIIGFSYRRVMYDYGREHFPDLPIMGTENLGQWHEWKAVMERDFVSGTFLWTGIDYMGEAHNRGYSTPRRGTTSGLLDYAGFPKGSYYMMKSLWSDKATLHITTQTVEKSLYKIENNQLAERKKEGWQHALWYWQEVHPHWNYQENENIVVEIISNVPELELFLNEKSLGVKKLIDFEDRLYKWLVPFEKGELLVKGVYDGKEISSAVVTEGTAAQLSVTADKTELKANAYDVAHLVVQIQDENDSPVFLENREIMFELSGPAKLLGVDNGSAENLQSYQSNKITTHQGRALAIVQTEKNKGKVEIKISAQDLGTKTIELTVN